MTKVREQAIEALLIEASAGEFVHCLEYCEGASNLLAYEAWNDIADQLPCATPEEIALEAAQLLQEGWRPGDKVVLL